MHPFYNISTASKTCACGGRQHSIYRLYVLILKHSQMGYCVLYVEMLKAIPFLRDEICFFWVRFPQNHVRFYTLGFTIECAAAAKRNIPLL